VLFIGQGRREEWLGPTEWYAWMDVYFTGRLERGGTGPGEVVGSIPS
jgi:hypothetical protein